MPNSECGLSLGVQYCIPSRVSPYLGREKREVLGGERDCPLPSPCVGTLGLQLIPCEQDWAAGVTGEMLS